MKKKDRLLFFGIVLFLLSCCANTQQEALKDAINQKNLAGVKAAINQDRRLIHTKLKRGDSPLHRAAIEGSLDIVRFLVSQGADVNTGNDKKQTPLHLAVYHNRLEVVKYLLSEGADVNAVTEHDQTPLYFAIFTDNIEVINILISQGADVNVRDEFGASPLHAALMAKRIETAAYLISKGADIHAKDKDGRTVLDIAKLISNDEIYAILSSAAASRTRDTLPPDISGSTDVMPRRTTQGRVALVIGNSAYKQAPLKNPVNDATLMADTLISLGFEVLLKENLTWQEMNEAIVTFGEKMIRGGVGLFYYAGHGAQINGKNYLVPTQSNIRHEKEVRYRAVDAGSVLAEMENAGNRINIVILDACRDNPFYRSFRTATRGLAFMDAPLGTMIAYATAPGKTAIDGPGENSLYTTELIRHMQRPGLRLVDVFNSVRRTVRAKTKGAQIPWESTSLEGAFYFKPSE